jgi:hypothetical protein
MRGLTELDQQSQDRAIAHIERSIRSHLISERASRWSTLLGTKRNLAKKISLFELLDSTRRNNNCSASDLANWNGLRAAIANLENSECVALGMFNGRNHEIRIGTSLEFVDLCSESRIDIWLMIADAPFTLLSTHEQGRFILSPAPHTTRGKIF